MKNKELIIIKGYLQLGIEQKKEQFEKFLDRIFYLTSDTYWYGEIISAKEGMYFALNNARSSFKVFINCHGRIERKPRKLTKITKYSIEGRDNEIERINEKISNK